MATPNGLFAQALTARSRAVLLWSLPFWIVFLLPATPWRGDDGRWAPAFALWAANARDGGMPVTGWISAGLWALAGLLALRITWRGLVGLLAPTRSGPWRDLARSGDAAGAVADFEREAAAPLLLRLSRPLVVVTPSWLLVRSGAVMQLVPLDDIAWVHGGKDASGAVVGGAFQLAGVIDAKERRAQAAQPDADLVLYRRSTGEREALPVDAALPALLDHFIAHRPEIVVGFAPALKTAWESDRAGFEAVARTAALSTMEPDAAEATVEALLSANDLAQAAVGLAQTSVAAFDPQADFETVIAPVKAAKGLGDQLAARAERAGPDEG